MNLSLQKLRQLIDALVDLLRLVANDKRTYPSAPNAEPCHQVDVNGFEEAAQKLALSVIFLPFSVLPRTTRR